MSELRGRGDQPDEPEEPDNGGGADRHRFASGEPPDWNAPRWQHADFELSDKAETKLSQASALSPREQAGEKAIRNAQLDNGTDERHDHEADENGADTAEVSAAGGDGRDDGGKGRPPVDQAEPLDEEPADDAGADRAEPVEGQAERDHDQRSHVPTLAVDGQYINAYLDPDAAAARDTGTRTPDPLPEERIGERIAERDQLKKSRGDRSLELLVEEFDDAGDAADHMVEVTHALRRAPDSGGPTLFGGSCQLPGPSVRNQPASAVPMDSLGSGLLALVAMGVGLRWLGSRWLHRRHERENP